MSEPSERMRILVGNVGNTAYSYGQDPRDENMAECSNQADTELLTAIAELEARAEKAEAEVKDMSRFLSTTKLEALCVKLFGCDKAAWWLGGENAPFIEKALHRIESSDERAEKWKRVAVAMYDWGTSFVPEEGETEEERSVALLEAAKRADRAVEALGDEWTEAVK